MNRKKREQLILDAAVRVFAKQGYPKTSVSEIIQEAKVARGTFYLYFKSKNELFTTLLERYLEQVAHDVTQVNFIATEAGSDLKKTIRTLCSDLITTLTRNRQLTKIILLDSKNLDQEHHNKLATFLEQLNRMISQQIQAHAQLGIFRSCQADIVARCIVGSVKEMTAFWITQENFELESAIQGMIDFLVAGLMPASAHVKAAAAAQEKTITPTTGRFH